jgi:hypothetical protein
LLSRKHVVRVRTRPAYSPMWSLRAGNLQRFWRWSLLAQGFPSCQKWQSTKGTAAVFLRSRTKERIAVWELGSSSNVSAVAFTARFWITYDRVKDSKMTHSIPGTYRGDACSVRDSVIELQALAVRLESRKRIGEAFASPHPCRMKIFIAARRALRRRRRARLPMRRRSCRSPWWGSCR